MLKFILKRLIDSKGLVDNILVPLLFIFLGVASIWAFSSWTDNQLDKIEIKTASQIDKLFEENPPAASSIGDIEIKDIEVMEIEEKELKLNLE